MTAAQTCLVFEPGIEKSIAILISRQNPPGNPNCRHGIRKVFPNFFFDVGQDRELGSEQLCPVLKLLSVSNLQGCFPGGIFLQSLTILEHLFMVRECGFMIFFQPLIKLESVLLWKKSRCNAFDFRTLITA